MSLYTKVFKYANKNDRQLASHFLSSARIYSALFLSLKPRADKYRDNQRRTAFPPTDYFHDSNMHTFDERKVLPRLAV